MQLRDYIIQADKGVVAWTTRRLPLEPKGWVAVYRDELRGALRGLPKAEGALVAEFAQTTKSRFDVENVLFYNVGASNLRHLCAAGIAFRRATDVGCPPALLPCQAPTRASYRIGAMPDWLDGSPAHARFSAAVPRLSSGTKPHTVWWNTKFETARGQVKGPFGLRVHVHPPRTRQSNPASYLKPLLDGIICALQADEAADTQRFDEAVRRVSHALGKDESVVAAKLLGAPALIGRTPLLMPYRNGVQWNPADDRCDVVVLSVGAPTEAGFRVTGTLHEL